VSESGGDIGWVEMFVQSGEACFGSWWVGGRREARGEGQREKQRRRRSTRWARKVGERKEKEGRGWSGDVL